MSNSFKICPTHFSRGGENFSRGASLPLVAGLVLTPTHPLAYALILYIANTLRKLMISAEGFVFM